MAIKQKRLRRKRVARQTGTARRTRVARALLFSATNHKEVAVNVTLAKAGNRRGGEGGYVVVEQYLRGHSVRNKVVSVRDGKGALHEFTLWWQEPGAEATNRVFATTRLPLNGAVASLVKHTLFKGELLAMKMGKREKYVHLSGGADRLLALKAVKCFIEAVDRYARALILTSFAVVVPQDLRLGVEQ
ncbi:hypothetical protein FOMPIDRAFT_1055054 [Fomitopsis schrenkii]|uniref:Uncharacterized protein n=1 Tax=Fomitopsis schrenkii TaxID=2126942 RepID=S8DTF1_FOMSC|nr:hypothetical protein FOMPIDRAFT_1055054 [Fomitopsis schrenkii]